MKPIYFQDESIEWLSSQPLPASLQEDLYKVDRHNAKYEAIQNQ